MDMSSFKQCLGCFDRANNGICREKNTVDLAQTYHLAVPLFHLRACACGNDNVAGGQWATFRDNFYRMEPTKVQLIVQNCLDKFRAAEKRKP